MYGPEQRKLEEQKNQKRSNSRGIPSGAYPISYANQNDASRRNPRDSAKSNNLSYRSDSSWSNARQIREFVTNSKIERQNVKKLSEIDILNNSLNEVSHMIFNRGRELEANSPLRILEGKLGQNLNGSMLGYSSRESTLSAKKKPSNLIYEQEDRSLVQKDKELNNILRESAKKFYQLHAEYS